MLQQAKNPSEAPDFGFTPRSSPAERVSGLLQHYLEDQQQQLFYRRSVPAGGRKPPKWELGLLRKSTVPGSCGRHLRVVALATGGVYELLAQYFMRWPALRELLQKLQKHFYRCSAARTFNLPEGLLVRGFGSFYQLRDGSAVWYGHNQPLFSRGWGESAHGRQHPPVAGVQGSGSDGEGEMAEAAAGASVPASDQPHTLLWLDTDQRSLLERAQRGVQLPQLRRFLHHPGLSYLQNQLRVLDFLRWLGRVRRRRWREDLGLLVYGPPGTGKTPFLLMVAEALFGEDRCHGLGFQGPRELFGPLFREVGGEVILVPEAGPGELQQLQRCLQQRARAKAREPSGWEESRKKVFLMDSDRVPEKLFAKDRETLDRLFPLQLELTHRLLSLEQSDGCDLVDALRGEMGEVLVYALLFSSPELEEELGELLRAAEGSGAAKRELLLLLRKPHRWLKRLGAVHRGLTEEGWLRQPSEGPEGPKETAVKPGPFEKWDRSLWEKDPEVSPWCYSDDE